jgi:hypothetical protein
MEHNETGVEAEGRSRRVEIPPQSQRRDGANVAAGVETVCSKKMIAPRCRGSRITFDLYSSLIVCRTIVATVGDVRLCV